MKKKSIILLNSCFFILIFSSCKTEKSFKIVLLPDTQCYAEYHPEIFYAQTDWIVSNKDSIEFVLHQGDITNRNSPEQWEVASKALHSLDGIVPYVLCTGNHDNGTKGAADTRDTHYFNSSFPIGKQSKLAGFGGAHQDDKMDNTWYTFNAGGINWLVISFEFGPRNKVINWAKTIIEKHPKHKVIINTHAYMYSDETRMSPERNHLWLPQSYNLGKNTTDEDSPNDGESMWQKLISQYPNVFMVVCGHVLFDGVGTLVSEGKHGNKVYQMLANYQCGVEGSENGGNGFLRILTMDISNNTISVQTYSPYLKEFKHEAHQEFLFKDVIF